MGKGRKKTPTVLKEMYGTARADRVLENEMQVDLLSELPEAPDLLSEIGIAEWYKVTTQLFNLKMLHDVDQSLILAYCNEMSLYIESELELRQNGRIDNFKNSNGDLIRSQAKPLVKVKNDALANALKLAVQFGLTPVARTNISAPVTNNNNTQINNYFD
jgi:P27 family predicted phage terminase small subunit